MRHAVTNWNKFVDIACAHRPRPMTAAWPRRVTITNKAARTLRDDTTIGCAG